MFYFALLISAIFTIGYYHPDEHYQIIEFAEMKLGHISPMDLPWEYQAGIRPMLQPFICYLSFKFLSFFGITDPYQLSLFLRLLTAFYAAVVVSSFVKNTQYLINPGLLLIYKPLSYFIWFIPFLSTRFSSETWVRFSRFGN
jgi:Alg9-like mannosyltransferase family.